MKKKKSTTTTAAYKRTQAYKHCNGIEVNLLLHTLLPPKTFHKTIPEKLMFSDVFRNVSFLSQSICISEEIFPREKIPFECERRVGGKGQQEQPTNILVDIRLMKSSEMENICALFQWWWWRLGVVWVRVCVLCYVSSAGMFNST